MHVYIFNSLCFLSAAGLVDIFGLMALTLELKVGDQPSMDDIIREISGVNNVTGATETGWKGKQVCNIYWFSKSGLNSWKFLVLHLKCFCLSTVLLMKVCKNTLYRDTVLVGTESSVENRYSMKTYFVIIKNVMCKCYVNFMLFIGDNYLYLDIELF